MNWIITIVVLVVIGFILDREVYFYEGVRLGPRVQAWLYDRWSKKYDEGKRASQLRDDEMLARPLLDAFQDVPAPFVLDFATGTGRLSYALTSRPEFKGDILALDLSQGMLEQASSKLGHRVERMDSDLPSRSRRRSVPVASAATEGSVELLRHQSLPLPFPDEAFDVVCALEVLEHFANMDELLAELTRVLRPGGTLLTSRGTEESGRKAKVRSEKQFTASLERTGLQDIRLTKWWKLYDRVLATKSGLSQPVSARKLSAVLRCLTCDQIQWQKEADALKCQSCGRELSITKEGIVLN